jgi:Methyltransferase domain
MSDHLHSEGAADWDIAPAVLAVLENELKAGSVTLETGAGRSTVVFAKLGCRHHCVTPSTDEQARITAACAREGIAMDKVSFHIGFSQDVLPRLETPPLDLALIDGGHGFPIPAVDWQYIAPKLKVGGLMIIDDVDLWTGAMIVDFLRGEAAWKEEAILRGRSAVFRLIAPFTPHEWTKQPTVVAKSRFTQARRKAMNALGMVFSGRIGEIGGKLANERRLAEAAKKDY